jgi:adenylyltransferase/sulfurtransferase
MGREGQEKLKKSSVLVVGAGGLGSPVLLYLAAAGIGRIGIVDFDIVDETNLQRQVLYNTNDLGKSKTIQAKEKIQALNPHIQIDVHETQLTSENALKIMAPYDIVADGTDNFPTRYLVNDACVLLDKINVYASIFRFEGQVSVINMAMPDGSRGPNYRDIFPEPPPPGMVPSCAEGGVLGVLPGIIGAMQANEVIKIAAGIGEPLAGRLFLFDAASFESRILKIHKDPNNSIEELIDYEAFCGIDKNDENMSSGVKEVSVKELKSMQDNGEDFQLIDVREPYEFEIANLAGELIPLDTVIANQNRISRDKKVIVHCRSGVRSANAIIALQDSYKFDNLYNLKGGILAYSDEIDPSLQKY